MAAGAVILIVIKLLAALLFAFGVAVLIAIVLYSINGVPEFIEQWLDRRIEESSWW